MVELFDSCSTQSTCPLQASYVNYLSSYDIMQVQEHIRALDTTLVLLCGVNRTRVSRSSFTLCRPTLSNGDAIECVLRVQLLFTLDPQSICLWRKKPRAHPVTRTISKNLRPQYFCCAIKRRNDV